MCLIVTLVMFVLSIQSFMQHQWLAGTFQVIISLGFLALLIRNVIAVKNQQQNCDTGLCTGTNWISKLLKRKQN
ncbi:MAG TPA: hypothetical protein EYH57_00585 [Sulfurovum sp.]|nr:hypothetical protein [Sulfurovum sp.]